MTRSTASSIFNFLKISLLFGFCISTLVLSGCASGSSDDSDDDANGAFDFNDDDSSDNSSTARTFTTDCGTVSAGRIVNPASTSEASLVSVVGVAGPNLVIVRTSEGDQLIKLNGISNTNERPERAMDHLRSLASGRAYLFSAGAAVESGDSRCIVSVPGGVAAAGSLFTESGTSYAESLIEAGVAGEIDQIGNCGESLLASCYSVLREENTQRSAGEITDFLWKPVAESDFNKGSPVIHVNPCDATVYVNGVAGTDFGPANGRCNTTRLFQSCGSYGSNIKVEVIDNDTGLPYFNGADPFVIVPNGCSRFEFKK